MKILKLKFVLIFTLLIYLELFSQNCGVEHNTTNPPVYSTTATRSNDIIYVAINYIIVRDTNNNLPIDQLDIDANIDYANEKFYPAGIQFYLCKISYTVPTNLANFYNSNSNYEKLYNLQDEFGSKYSKNNMINVYHINSFVGTSNYNGYARFPNETYNNMILLTRENPYLSSILSHELGHYFGLLHTFNGSSPSTLPLVNQPKYTIYNINNSIALIGDGIEDTPSDPGNCSALVPSCIVSCDTPNDPNGVPYDVINQRENIMSYRCEKDFTPQQITAMIPTFGYERSNVTAPSPIPECIDFTIGNVHKLCGDDIIGYFEVPIRNAKINISKKPSGSSCNKRTDSGGNYNIRNCVDFGTNDTILNAPSKFISGEKLYEHFNGVSTADLVAINKHILFVETLKNPYYWLAADVNYDGKISTADMVKTRKIILRIDNEFDATNSWRFVPDWYQEQPSFSSTFNDILNGNTSGPFKAVWISPSNIGLNYSTPATPENTYLDHFNALANMQNIQSDTVWSFTAVKTGDVNCSSKVDYSSFTVDDENLTLNVAPHLCIPAGDTATFDLIATVNSNMVAYQTQLDFNLPENPLALPGDGSPFEVFNISAGQLINTPTEYYNLVSNNYRKHLKVSWMSDSLTQTNLSNGVSILQFSIKANQTICNIGSIVSNTAKELSSQLYSPSGQLLNNTYLQLVRNDIQSRSKNNNDPKDIDFSVYPNPFLDELNFAISNEIDQPIELILYNSTGQMVQSIKKQGAKGVNVIAIDTKGVKDNILIYHLKVGNKTYRDKVIKLNK